MIIVLGASDGMSTWCAKIVMSQTTYPPPTPTTYAVTFNYWRTDYKLYKVPLWAIAIDSRTIYGQPDMAGEYQADPNAPSRNVLFNPWIFRGGLYMGNAAFSTGDQSGTARTQLSASALTLVNPSISDLSIVYLGQSATLGAPVTMGVYQPSTGDPNYNQNQQTVTWATGWGLPGSPIRTVNLTTNTPTSQYLNVPCSVQSGLNLDFILALNNESQFVQANHSGWQYFANPVYAAQFPSTYPFNDATPRVWVLDQVNRRSWVAAWNHW